MFYTCWENAHLKSGLYQGSIEFLQIMWGGSYEKRYIQALVYDINQ